MPLAALTSTSEVVFLFATAGLVLYVASRAAVDALTRVSDPAPGKWALGHWIPIGWAALLATAAGRSEVGVGLAFATSVASMGMVLGVLTCISGVADGPRQHTRAWPFVVPAALLALLAGFSGSLTWWHALMLLGLGACVMSVWVARRSDDEPLVARQAFTVAAAPEGGFEVLPPQPERPDAVPAIAASPPSPALAAPPAPPAPTPITTPPTENQWRGTQLLLAIALAAAGGWLAYRATTVADDRTRVASSGLIAAAVISPLLVLPMLGTGAIAAHHGRLASATAGIVGVVLLNLCALLPLVILTHYARQAVVDWEQVQPAVATTAPADSDEATAYKFRPVPFPLAVWRVDTVLLIVFGMLLLPVSLGRLTLRKPEGLAMGILYVVYLVVSTALAVRA